MRLPKIQTILNKTNSRCAYCGRSLKPVYATRDPLLPISRGGKNGAYNLIASCSQCNDFKADLTLDEFRLGCIKLFNSKWPDRCHSLYNWFSSLNQVKFYFELKTKDFI